MACLTILFLLMGPQAISKFFSFVQLRHQRALTEMPFGHTTKPTTNQSN